VQASPDDIRELKEIFMSIDKNGDGNLTFEELKTGLESKQNAKELMEVMMAADTDNSGTINYTGKYLIIRNVIDVIL
jgi:calcium-dependent protein kinase